MNDTAAGILFFLSAAVMIGAVVLIATGAFIQFITSPLGLLISFVLIAFIIAKAVMRNS
jgi:hypothetical protein